MRWRGGVRPSKVNTTLLIFGLVLLLVACLGPRVTIDDSSIGPGASWWQRVAVLVVGLLSVGWAVLATRRPVRVLRTGRGFLGTAPPMPSRPVPRPDLVAAAVQALHTGASVLALTGIGGTGKSTLAAVVCRDRQTRRAFPDGITWLETVPGQDPMVLLANLGRRLGLPGATSGFASVSHARDDLAVALQGKKILISLDNVWERGPLDVLNGLAPACAVLFTTRLPELAITVNATQIVVEELSQDQALQLLGLWTKQAPDALPESAHRLCLRLGNLALGIAMAGAMVAHGRSFTDVLELIEMDLTRVQADLDPAYPYQTLFAAINASVDDLPNRDQERYEELAVFSGQGIFTREEAAELWQLESDAAEVGDLLAEFIGRSLLTVSGEGLYVAHELQYDIMARRLGADGFTAVLDRLAAVHKLSSEPAHGLVKTEDNNKATRIPEIEGRQLSSPDQIAPGPRDFETIKIYEVVLGPAAMRAILGVRNSEGRDQIADALRKELLNGPNADKEYRFDSDGSGVPSTGRDAPSVVYTATPLTFNAYVAIHRPMTGQELSLLRRERGDPVTNHGFYVLDILPGPRPADNS